LKVEWEESYSWCYPTLAEESRVIRALSCGYADDTGQRQGEMLFGSFISRSLVLDTSALPVNGNGNSAGWNGGGSRGCCCPFGGYLYKSFSSVLLCCLVDLVYCGAVPLLVRGCTLA